jgi:hypothetical protein
MGPGNMLAVGVWTAKTRKFSSRPCQNPDPVPWGGSNQNQYTSTRGVFWVWLDPSVWIPGLALLVSWFIVAFSYTTVKRIILRLLSTFLFWMYCSPLWWKRTDTTGLRHPEIKSLRSINNCLSGNMHDQEGDRLQIVGNIVLAAFLDIRQARCSLPHHEN